MRPCRVLIASMAAALLLTASAGPALASGIAPVPEIDGVTVSAGFGLLAAGVLMLRARRRR